MLQTFKYKIKSNNNNIEMDNIIHQYTGLFFKLYNNIELAEDKTFKDECKVNFNLPVEIYNYCVTDVKMTLASLEEIKKDKLKTLDLLTKELNSLLKINRLTKKQKKHKLKLESKINFIKKNIDKGICFGGKHLLRKITKLKQKEVLTDKEVKLLDKLLNEFKQNRKRSIFLVGRACENGNRYIDFNLLDNYIIFKINKNTHIKLELNSFNDKNRIEIIKTLQLQINNNEIPVTVRLDKKNLYLTFDNEKLNNFAFDNSYCDRIKEKYPELTNKEVKIKGYEEQTERKLKGKLVNRVAGIDMNPDYIGFSICDINQQTNEVNKVIFARLYNLKQFTEHKYKSKSNQKKIVRKHKQEIHLIYKDIFKFCKHYKVSRFGIEGLTNITTENVSDNYTSFNRKVKNIWYRGLQEGIVSIKCDSLGIIKNEVEARYSSFIGNLSYDYFDAVGASIEIGRRSYTIFKKCDNRIYPTLTNYVYERLNHRSKVVVVKKESWVSLHKECKQLCYGDGGWWREKTLSVGKTLNSKKSMITYH